MPRLQIYMNTDGDDFVEAFKVAGLDPRDTTIMMRPGSSVSAHVYTLVAHAANSTAIASSLINFVNGKSGRVLSVEMNDGAKVIANQLTETELGRLLGESHAVRIDHEDALAAGHGTGSGSAPGAKPWWKFWA